MTKNLLRRLVHWASEMPHPAEQYYSPQLGLSEERALLRRHYLLLQTARAALGLISPDVLGIAVGAQRDEVIIHVAVASRTEAVDEDIAEIANDLRAFLAGGPERLTRVSTAIHIGRADLGWPGRCHDLLYLAKAHAVGDE